MWQDSTAPAKNPGDGKEEVKKSKKKGNAASASGKSEVVKVKGKEAEEPETGSGKTKKKPKSKKKAKKPTTGKAKKDKKAKAKAKAKGRGSSKKDAKKKRKERHACAKVEEAAVGAFEAKWEEGQEGEEEDAKEGADKGEGDGVPAIKRPAAAKGASKQAMQEDLKGQIGSCWVCVWLCCFGFAVVVLLFALTGFPCKWQVSQSRIGRAQVTLMV